MSAIERVRRLSNRLSRLLQQEHGLSVYQFGILAAVEDGARQLNEVAEATGQPVSGASRLVERLVNDGLLDRGRDARDRRAVVLALTPAGVELLAAGRSTIGGAMERALGEVPAGLAGQLLPALAAFLDRAECVLGEPPRQV
jgi:DNA-binding MarR family transcriptional regulator